MAVTLKVDESALHQLHQGLASGVLALAEATVAEAMTRKPKKATVGVVVTLGGAILEGNAEPPPGLSGPAIQAFAVFGEPSAYEEFGTPAHDIVAKHGNAMKLPDGRFVSGTVRHPGAKANPFINPATEMVMAQAETHLVRGIARRYR